METNRPSGPKYLAIWSDEFKASELIAQTVSLLLEAQRIFLIYEEVEGRPHHSETPIGNTELLTSMVSEMASETAFYVLSDLETFALVPIATNEFVIIHDGSVAFEATAGVQSRDSTSTYENGDWFAFLEPEIAVIMAP